MARDNATTLSFDGDDPVEELQDALDIIDTDAATRIDLTVHTGEDNGSDDQPDPTGPSVEDGWERAGEQPGNVRANTYQHVALVSLAWMLDDLDADAANPKELSHAPWCPLSERQAGNALGQLFRSKAALTRRWSVSDDGGGGTFRYRLSGHGEREAARLGEWSDDAVPDSEEADDDGGGSGNA